MFQGKNEYLDAIKDIVEIHGTVAVGQNNELPPYVHNHGVLNATDLYNLLRQSKVGI